MQKGGLFFRRGVSLAAGLRNREDWMDRLTSRGSLSALAESHANVFVPRRLRRGAAELTVTLGDFSG